MVNPYHQTITYWPPGVPDGYGGFVPGAPQVLKGRWEERQEQFLNPQMEEELSQAVVFMPSSYTPKTGGYLLLGESASTDPASVDGAITIRQVLRTPDLRNVKMELRVIL